MNNLMCFLNSIRPILESLYFIASIFLPIIAFYGLRQIQIAKSDIEIRSKRESISFSLRQTEKFIEEIIPLINGYNDIFKKNKIIHYQGKVNFNLFEKDANDWNKKYKSQILKTKNLLEIILQCINKLEAISNYFVKDNAIADQNIAFSSIGITFCDTIKDLYPIISIYREDNKNYYKNLINLYKVWDKELEQEKTKKEYNTIRKYYLELKNKINKIKPETNSPIGTK